ncbi:FliM/FliN family flagellar motor switch protein [Dinoroseobacter shibae]|jgi:flagellar motor switch protein FliM|nr:flagellar motor switch protein FliM [Dinoroseobacter shibae]URF48076.1 FliM/FliN family flagellar motor switch protein [Dinoroseobacter shibae]URF52386.1 FliM/FliN family flagellar motor switch protein [Dinoroseobacter shibae]
MSVPDQSALLRRKMESSPAAQGGSAAPVSPEMASLRAVARAGFIAAGLKIAAPSVQVVDTDGVAGLAEQMADVALLIPCNAPDGAEGFAALSSGGMTGLVEKTTTGRISPGEPEPRDASSIDQLLCRGFIERFFEAWGELLAGTSHEAWLAGYAPTDGMMQPDVLSVSAPDIPYRLYLITAQFDGLREVAFSVALPVSRPRPADLVETGDAARSTGEWAKDWRAAVLESPAELDAVLCKLELSLDEVRRWAPGDRVSIPASALSSVSLGRRNGPSVATARLGQARGVRALRLNEITTQRVGGIASRPVPPEPLPPGAGFQDEAGIPAQVAPPEPESGAAAGP